MPDSVQRLIQRARKPLRTWMITLQQMECHALRRFWPDAGQAAQGFDQFFKS